MNKYDSLLLDIQISKLLVVFMTAVFIFIAYKLSSAVGLSTCKGDAKMYHAH